MHFGFKDAAFAKSIRFSEQSQQTLGLLMPLGDLKPRVRRRERERAKTMDKLAAG